MDSTSPWMKYSMQLPYLYTVNGNSAVFSAAGMGVKGGIMHMWHCPISHKKKYIIDSDDEVNYMLEL